MKLHGVSETPPPGISLGEHGGLPVMECMGTNGGEGDEEGGEGEEEDEEVARG